jgi:probable O-glycosylation ligase (exosortase A-associated)
MKQFALMTIMMIVGSIASLIEPFWGLLLYYTLAVLRPQYMWKWALPIEVRWSLLAATVATLTAVLNYDRIFQKARLNPIATLTLGYSALLLLSMLAAYDPAIAQVWGIEYGKIIFMSLLASVIIRNLGQVKALSLMVMLMVGYIAWEINSLYLFNGRLDIFHVGYGDLDNNGAGLLLAMGIPFAYCFAVSSPRAWQRWFCWFLAVLMLHAMIMSYSRGAMLATAIGAVWLLINHRPRIQAAAIAIVLCVVVSVLAGQEIRDRVSSTFNRNRDYSAQSRLASWSAGWELAWQRPLIGQGIRNSGQYIHSYGADRRGRTIHNQFLQVAADSGIPAACVYIVILCMAIYRLQISRTICRRFLDHGLLHHQPRGPNGDDHDLIHLIERVSLAIQTGLIIFSVGCIFLSLEMIELPWLMITLGGVLPITLERHLAGQTDSPLDHDRAPDPVAPARPHHGPHRGHMRPITA